MMTIIRTGLVTLLLASIGHAQAPPVFDLIVRHGTVIDGTGNPRYDADIGIRNGYITAIGDLAAAARRPRSRRAGCWSRPASSTSTATPFRMRCRPRSTC